VGEIIFKTLFLIVAVFFTVTHADIIGGYTSDFFDYGVGARYIAMGGAGRSIVDDADAGYWNPALLPKVPFLNLRSMTSTLLGVTHYNQLAISIPLSDIDMISFTYLGMGMDSLEIHLSSIPSATPEGSFDVNKSALMLSYGRKMNDNLNLGITGKYGMRKVYEQQDSVMAFDLGAFLDLGLVQCGGTVKNVFVTMMGDQTVDKYDMDVDLGVSTKWNNMLFSVDMARLMRKDLSLYAGVEYEAFSIKDAFNLKLRGGINSNELSIGLGVFSDSIVFDYTYLIRSMSQEQLFSFGLDFNETAKNQKMLNAEKLYKKAISAIETYNFTIAKTYVTAGLLEYSNLFVLRDLNTRLNFVLAFKASDAIKDDNGRRLLRDSFQDFLLQKWDDSLDTTEYLVSKYDGKDLNNYQMMIESLSKKASKFKGKDIVKTYIEEAMGGLMVDDLKTSTIKLEQILYFEPENMLVLKRLGSNYYVLGNKDKALEIWRRVLAIDPNDKEVAQFVKNMGVAK